MLSSGDADPDVVFVKSAATEMTYHEKGQIMQLDELIERDGLDLSGYNGVAEQLQIDGETYSLPFRLDWYLLFYNKDLFDAAGVEYPSNDMTWTEYEELAQRMTSGEGSEKVYGSFHQTWLNLVSNWAVQDGTHTLADGEYSFMKDTYERVLRMQEDGVVQDYATLKTANIRYTSAFEQQQCAMCPMGSWFVATLIKDKAEGAFDFDWGIAVIPHSENTVAGYTVASSTPVAISANTDEPDAAWEFVKFATSEECAEILATNGIFAAMQTEAVREKLAAVEGMPEGSADALLVTNAVFDSPITAGMAEIGKILEEENDLIMIGEQDIDTGIANMNERVSELMEE
jgi:multiple sugar transport system substrate-binding protein